MMHRLMKVAVPENHVAIHWFGQSSFALKGTDHKIVLIDPYFPHERPADKFIHAQPPLDASQLPVDYVLLTHDHSDHTDPETLRRVRAASPAAPIIAPSESIAHLQDEGFDADGLVTINAGDVLRLDIMTIHAVWAKLPEGDPDRQIAPPNVQHFGFVIDLNGVRLYVSGDPINIFAEQELLWRPVANLRPDVGLLTTHPTEGEFPFFDGSAEMARKIGLKHVIPSHYQCFVKRSYDPQDWSVSFGKDDPEPLLIAYNRMVIYPPMG